MNLYSIIIRSGSVTFTLLVSANTKKSARRRAGKIIRTQYQNFHIYRIG